MISDLWGQAVEPFLLRFAQHLPATLAVHPAADDGTDTSSLKCPETRFTRAADKATNDE
jgi:hypothetical protein